MSDFIISFDIILNGRKRKISCVIIFYCKSHFPGILSTYPQHVSWKITTQADPHFKIQLNFRIPSHWNIPNHSYHCSPWSAVLYMYYSIIGWGFCDIWNDQGRGECSQPNQIPRLITLTETLIIIIVLLYIVLKKKMTNTPSQGTWIDVVIGNHALCAQPTDKSVIH